MKSNVFDDKEDRDSDQEEEPKEKEVKHEQKVPVSQAEKVPPVLQEKETRPFVSKVPVQEKPQEQNAPQKQNESQKQNDPQEVVAPQPKKKGRPRKYPLPDATENQEEKNVTISEFDLDPAFLNQFKEKIRLVHLEELKKKQEEENQGDILVIEL